jgi:hypothetical protein
MSPVLVWLAFLRRRAKDVTIWLIAELEAASTEVELISIRSPYEDVEREKGVLTLLEHFPWQHGLKPSLPWHDASLEKKNFRHVSL